MSLLRSCTRLRSWRAGWEGRREGSDGGMRGVSNLRRPSTWYVPSVTSRVIFSRPGHVGRRLGRPENTTRQQTRIPAQHRQPCRRNAAPAAHAACQHPRLALAQLLVAATVPSRHAPTLYHAAVAEPRITHRSSARTPADAAADPAASGTAARLIPCVAPTVAWATISGQSDAVDAAHVVAVAAAVGVEPILPPATFNTV